MGISLSLRGEKVGLTITEGEVDELRAQGGRCLVGRIWMGRTVNKEAFKSVLSRIWRTIGGVTFRELDDNIWLFEFKDGDDMRRVLGGRPWSYDKQMLVLTEFEELYLPHILVFLILLFGYRCTTCCCYV